MMMNNYESVPSEELAERERMQERHYSVLKELQSIAANEVPLNYQQRLPNELLSNLASCLLDKTISMIVAQLKDIQQIKEKKLFEKRMKHVQKFREMKVDLMKKNRTAMINKEMTQEEARKKEKELERYIEEESNKIDMKIILELDQMVSEQQVTLEKAGVPGFSVTNNPNEIRLQMYILVMITKLSQNT